jgi:hypothetical protein
LVRVDVHVEGRCDDATSHSGTELDVKAGKRKARQRVGHDVSRHSEVDECGHHHVSRKAAWSVQEQDLPEPAPSFELRCGRRRVVIVAAGMVMGEIMRMRTIVIMGMIVIMGIIVVMVVPFVRHGPLRVLIFLAGA